MRRRISSGRRRGGEAFGAPGIGPAVAAGGFGDAFFEGVAGAGGVGVGGRFIEEGAEVDEVFVAGRAFVAGVGLPFGDEGFGGHGAGERREFGAGSMGGCVDESFCFFFQKEALALLGGAGESDGASLIRPTSEGDDRGRGW